MLKKCLKNGQEVFSTELGWGRVQLIENGIKVYFGEDVIQYYNKEGYRVVKGSLINEPDKCIFAKYKTLFCNEVEVNPEKKIKLHKEDKFLFAIFQHPDLIKPWHETKIEDFHINQSISEYGLARNDLESSLRALKELQKYAQLLALRDFYTESSRSYVFNPNKANYSIAYCHEDKKFYISENNSMEEFKVYFNTREDAEKIMDILNRDYFSF